MDEQRAVHPQVCLVPTEIADALTQGVQLPRQRQASVVITDHVMEVTVSVGVGEAGPRQGKGKKDRVSGADVAINVRAIGLNSGQWVQQTATIAEVNNNPVSEISAVERNYSNPA